MHNATHHDDQTSHVADPGKNAPTAVPTKPYQTLAPRPMTTRLTAFVLALVTTGLVLGSQLGLGMMYEGQAEAELANAQAVQPTVQLVATAN